MPFRDSNPFTRVEQTIKDVKMSVDRGMEDAFLDVIDSIQELSHYLKHKNTYANKEALFKAWDEMDTKFGREEASLLRKSHTVLTRLEGITGFFVETFSKEDTRRCLLRNAKYIEEDSQKPENSFEKSFLRQEIPELKQFTESDLEKIQQYISQQSFSPEERLSIETYLEYARSIMHKFKSGELTGQGMSEGLDRTLASKSAARLFRQETYPLFPLLAKIETQERQETFNQILHETLDFLHQAFPDLDEAVLAERASKLRFSVQSTVETYRDWEGAGGIYNPAKHEVMIRRDVRNDEEVFRHEILHGLSHDLDEDTLDFRDDELNEDARRMLTEAVVEELNQFGEIGDETSNDSYVRERVRLLNVVRRMWGNGPEEIPFSVFAETLFSREKNLGQALRKNGLSNDHILKIFGALNQEAPKITYDRQHPST